MGADNRAVIYVRESLDRYGDERALERFEQQCRQLCQARGLRVLRVLRDNDVRASNGNKGDGFAEVKRMLRERLTDYVVIPVVDRFFRHPRDLEDVIDICLETGASLVAASGEIDLSHDQGRLVARLLTSVAKAETERKGKRQADANEQAARAGKRRMCTPMPFGWLPDRTTRNPAEADAIRWAADELLRRSTVSSVAREWIKRGLRPPQAPFGPLPEHAWTRNSVTTIMRNPALAGLSVYQGEVCRDEHGEPVEGDWEKILTRETHEAVCSVLDDPARKPPRGVRTLLGGLLRCRCGNVVLGGKSYQGNHVYKCGPGREGDGPHSAMRAKPVDDYVERVILARLSRADLADLLVPARDVDGKALRTEAAAIRRNLDELAADRALGLVTRSQMLKATERGNARLEEIAGMLADSEESRVLAPFLAGEAAAKVWAGLDLARRRGVIATLCTLTLHPAGRGARTFDPATVQVNWLNGD